jgi:hypothetical protein
MNNNIDDEKQKSCKVKDLKCPTCNILLEEKCLGERCPRCNSIVMINACTDCLNKICSNKF